MENIIFRQAVREDMPQIMKLQTDVSNGEQKIPAKDINGFLDKNPQCWCAVLNGVVIGTAAAWRENGEIHWGRFAIHPDYRGHHIGTRIARLSFDDLFALGIEEIRMEARDITAKMVCRMGGLTVGNPQQFYMGTITPVVLKRSSYHH